MLNNISSSSSHKLSFGDNKKKQVEFQKNQTLNNVLVATSATAAGAGIAGGITLAECLKHAKIKFAIFAKNKLKNIRNFDPNPGKNDFGNWNPRAAIRDAHENKRFAVKDPEGFKKLQKSSLQLFKEAGLTGPEDLFTREIKLLDSFVDKTKLEFSKKFKAETIKKVAVKAGIGAAAGLAVGLTIIGLGHLINQNKAK